MRSGLWGHALFLASKMDQRTYAGVMTRSEPCQTRHAGILNNYLLTVLVTSAFLPKVRQRTGHHRPPSNSLSTDVGQDAKRHEAMCRPEVIFCFSIFIFSFHRWGDWRPHLAMILSNPLPDSDINRRFLYMTFVKSFDLTRFMSFPF